MGLDSVLVLVSFSPSLIVPALVIAAAGLYVARASGLIAYYRDGFDAISRFSRVTASTDDSTVLMDALLASARRISDVSSCAIAHVTNDGSVVWIGDQDPSLREVLSGRDAIESIADSGVIPVRGRGGNAAAAWPLDDCGERFLIAVSKRQQRDSNDWKDLVAELAAQAKDAIAAAHQTAELTRRSEEDYLRARTDDLTRLPNRFATREYLGAYLDGDGAAESLSLVAASVNGLQGVHDVLGEAFANQMLIDFSKEISELPQSQFVSTLARNQFLVIVEGGTEVSLPIATQLANYQNPESSIRHHDASVGIVAHRSDAATSPESLLNQARWSLERAQATGAIEVFTDASIDDQNRRLVMQMNLANAIAQRRIVPFFQPLVRLKDNKLVGVESLARWTDDTLGSISPLEFIPIAESALHIEALTKSMVAQSASALTGWRNSGLAIDVSINVSGPSLDHDDFVNYLSEVIHTHDQPASRLSIEIAESSLTADDTTLSVLHQLHRQGAKLSIDDFGTGFSSLSSLNSLPADVIKIDQSMVKELRGSTDQAHIVEGIISIGHKLGFEIVAEGIEDGETMRLLTDMGCDIGQGFFIGVPMSEADFNDWLQTHHLAQTGTVAAGGR